MTISAERLELAVGKLRIRWTSMSAQQKHYLRHSSSSSSSSRSRSSRSSRSSR